MPPALMHGDFHIANVMFDSQRPAVTAVADCEMRTVGDPMLDVGWWLTSWPSPDRYDPGNGSPVLAAGGLASPAELMERCKAPVAVGERLHRIALRVLDRARALSAGAVSLA